MAEQINPEEKECESILQSASQISQLISQSSNIIAGVNVSKLSRVSGWISSSIQQNKLPCASLAVFRRNELVYECYQGYSDLDSSSTIDKDSLFRIYSMTKPITAIGLMMLFEQNKFKLDDPVSKYIPSFANIPGVYDYEGNKGLSPENLSLDAIKLIPLEQPILVWHVLSHTSGLSYGFDTSGKHEPVDYLLTKEVNFHEDLKSDLADLIDNKLTKIPLVHQPGSEWTYSLSSDVCGRLIEVLSGMPLDAYLDAKIFKPLGMAQTAFYLDNKFTQLQTTNLTTLYQPSWFGKPPHEVKPFEWTNYKTVKCAIMQNQTNPDGKGVRLSGGGSAGGLISTMHDYLKFAKMLLNRGTCKETGKQIISEKTLQLMTKNYLPNDGELYACCNERSMIKQLLKPKKDAGLTFGLGFGIVKNNMFFWGGAAGTKFWIDPENELCMVWMTQLLGHSDSTFDVDGPLRKYIYTALTDLENK